MEDRLHDPNQNFYGLSDDFQISYPYLSDIFGSSKTAKSSQVELLKKITNLTPNLVALYNIKTGKYVFINKSIKPILGYEPSDWMRRDVSYVSSKVHPEDLPRIMKQNQKAIEDDAKLKRQNGENPIVEFEYRIQNSKGEYRWLKTYGTVFDRDESGKVRHVINISLDITAIKNTEDKLLTLTNELEQKVEQRSRELTESAKKFQALIENSSDAIVLINRFGRLQYISPGAQKILGYTPQELMAFDKLGSLIHKDDKKAVFKLFTIHFKKPEDKLQTRFRVRNKKGGYIWVEVIASNQLREKSIGAIVINFRDITGQVLSERRQQEEIQNTGLRLDINEALSQNHDLGKTLNLCVQAIVNRLDAIIAKIWIFEKRSMRLKLFAFSGTKDILNEKMDKPHWAKLRDGRIIGDKKAYLTNDAIHDKEVKDKAWIRKYSIKSFAGFPLILDGKLIGLLTLFSQKEIPPHTYEALHSATNSITQGIGRLWAKEDLVESEQKYHTIFSTLTEGVVLQDHEGKIIAVNSSAQKILGVNLDELKKRSTANRSQTVYINEDGSLFDTRQFPYLLALNSGQPQKNRVMGIIKDKQTTWISTNSIPLTDDEGVIYAVASSFQDITEQKRLEKQKDEFISIASHELKTPLTTIKSFNEILKMQFKKEEKAQYYLSKMHGEIDRLTSLVNELLDVSKIQSGRLTLNKESVPIDKFIREVVEDIQTATSSHKIINKNQLTLKVNMDKYRMYQVLINLISNAIKYSPKSDKVIISTQEKLDRVVFSVKDFGIGISKRDRRKIFDAFFQASTTIRQSHSGLGLGLHIAGEIVKRHGGTISVYSKKGSGSVFRFYIPTSESRI